MTNLTLQNNNANIVDINGKTKPLPVLLSRVHIILAVAVIGSKPRRMIVCLSYSFGGL